RQEQLVAAFDRQTGAAVWQQTVHSGGFPDRRDIHPKGTFANSTIAADGDRLFVTFLNQGQIFVTALSLQGDILWQQPAGTFSSKFGYAPSPVLYKSLVIVAGDNWGSGFVAALNRETGELAWRKQRPSVSTYSSPLLVQLQGVDHLVLSGCEQLVSFDPATGEQRWAVAGTAEATCGTAVTDGERIFASGGYPEQQTIAVDSAGQLIWSNRTKSYEPSMVVVNGLLIAVTDDGIAYCWDGTDGRLCWRERLSGSFSASPIAAGDRVYVPNLNGVTTVFRPTDAAIEVLSRNQLGNDCYASFAASRGQLFGRFGFGEGRDRHEKLVCIGALSQP
ncbi:MAG: PQQ-like beta-propeller repeat protein, partial [Planctomycetaceae bacterium]|nr:PQQ-like beta-propeller repeat protein [Planctomycetaceae bacterium]